MVPAQRSEIKKMRKTRSVETTLGDLIAAASEVAFEYSTNDTEAYNLAQLALIEILKKTSYRSDLDKDFETLEPPSQLIH
jgi:hypothetical protein